MNDIGKLFKGNTEWVDWINDYMKRTEPNNPHKENKHTNLAWLLQYSAVQVMTGTWQTLKDKDIPFLTMQCRRVEITKKHWNAIFYQSTKMRFHKICQSTLTCQQNSSTRTKKHESTHT